MELKKFKVLILITSLLLCLTSCGNPRSLITSATANPFEKIISAIQEKNTEDLESLFSPNALKEAKDFDGGAEYLFDFFQGDIITTDVASVTSGSNNNGEKLKEVSYKYTVETSKDKYIVYFSDVLVDTENPDNEGLYMLQIIKESAREQQFDWGGDKTKCAGIYLPPIVEDSTTEPAIQSNSDGTSDSDNLNQILYDKVCNFELINCIGKTQKEISELYGPIVSGNETSGYVHSEFPETAYAGYIYSEEDKSLICFCVGINVMGLISDFDKINIDRSVWGENEQGEDAPYVVINLQDGLVGYLTQRAERYIQAGDDVYIRQ